jgi:hypothetical protein
MFPVGGGYHHSVQEPRLFQSISCENIPKFDIIYYPSFEKELEIVRAHIPGAPEKLAQQITDFFQALREMDIYKLPDVAETLDWTTALVALDQRALDIVVETTPSDRYPDISGLIERYMRLLLHFIYGMKYALSQPMEAFVFSTRLTASPARFKFATLTWL